MILPCVSTNNISKSCPSKASSRLDNSKSRFVSMAPSPYAIKTVTCATNASLNACPNRLLPGPPSNACSKVSSPKSHHAPRPLTRGAAGDSFRPARMRRISLVFARCIQPQHLCQRPNNSRPHLKVNINKGDISIKRKLVTFLFVDNRSWGEMSLTN